MAKYWGWNDTQLTEALMNRKKTELQQEIVSIPQIIKISNILLLFGGTIILTLFPILDESNLTQPQQH